MRTCASLFLTSVQGKVCQGEDREYIHELRRGRRWAEAPATCVLCNEKSRILTACASFATARDEFGLNEC